MDQNEHESNELEAANWRALGSHPRYHLRLMKRNFGFIIPAITLALSAMVGAQETDKPDVSKNQKEPAREASPSKPKATQEQLEAAFKATLTKATLKGRWCSVKDGQLGADQEEKYTITSVLKIGGDMWLVNARIQYGKKDFSAPVPVQVKWAGDTPVIILDRVGVAGSGEYSARVMIYEKTYAGTWNGGGHGGLLNGVITVEKE